MGDGGNSAEDLLGFLEQDPLRAPLRMAAVAASLFEEDPVLHEWCGLYAFIAESAADSLRIGVGFYDELFGYWAREPYLQVIPLFLTFRRKMPVTGPFAEAFVVLEEARSLRRLKKRDETLACARRGTDLLVAAVQQKILQTYLNTYPAIVFEGVGAYVAPTLTGAGPIPFEGNDFYQVDARIAYIRDKLLAALRQEIKNDPQGLVRRLQKIQANGWFKRSQLPDKTPPPPPENDEE